MHKGTAALYLWTVPLHGLSHHRFLPFTRLIKSSAHKPPNCRSGRQVNFHKYTTRQVIHPLVVFNSQSHVSRFQQHITYLLSSHYLQSKWHLLSQPNEKFDRDPSLIHQGLLSSLLLCKQASHYSYDKTQTPDTNLFQVQVAEAKQINKLIII